MRTQGLCGENKHDFVVACGGDFDQQTTPWACIGLSTSEVFRAAVAQDWDWMAAVGRLAGPRGGTGKWGDMRHSNNYGEYEGLEVGVKIERREEVFRVVVNAKHYDDATAGDYCYVCCCTNKSDCVVL
jgi:hypothetical protein